MFESVDARTDGRMPARVPSYKLTLLAFGSGELKISSAFHHFIYLFIFFFLDEIIDKFRQFWAKFRGIVVLDEILFRWITFGRNVFRQ